MKKIELGMWVPNSERGHKKWLLEGENEIPQIPKLDFFSKNVIFAIWGELIRKWGMEFEDRLALTQYNSKPTKAISILKSAFWSS